MMETQFESNKFYILFFRVTIGSRWYEYTVLQCSIGYIMELWAIKNIAEAAESTSIYY